MKKYQIFYLEILFFFGDKFSVYLNRCVFVMMKIKLKDESFLVQIS